ncbi:MAG: FAD/NAD(P)-binding protein [Stagnimonas sp.]|nr:FAD/NAD(P)-binding protein [Stagnimonas sp.]
MKTIVVIGAGFCGTAVAVQLLRQAGAEPTRLLLLNRSGLMARGVAYGTRTESHVLNVPAGRMSALPDDPESFLRYAQGRDVRVTGASFVQRRWFGDYLEDLLAKAAHAAAPHVRFRAMVGDVIGISIVDGKGQVELASGECIVADRVVLALGNFAPADPPLADASFFTSARYVRDPWRPDALRNVRPDQAVMLIGTGLTMLDVLLDLRSRGHHAPIYALSRRGLLPQAHRTLEEPPRYRGQLAERLAKKPNARAALAMLRRELRAAASQNIDWRDVIGGLRKATPAIWASWPEAERRRFLRHARPHWEIHRHRCAPQQNAALCAELAEGRLRVLAGRLLSCDDDIDGVTLHWRERGAGTVHQQRVGSVINCTGPASDTRQLREPLLLSLAASGLLRRDALGLGLETSDDYALLDRQGKPSIVLHYVGPFLKAQWWEATAVPELSEHTARLARELIASLSKTGAAPTRQPA